MQDAEGIRHGQATAVYREFQGPEMGGVRRTGDALMVDYEEHLIEAKRAFQTVLRNSIKDVVFYTVGFPIVALILASYSVWLGRVVLWIFGVIVIVDVIGFLIGLGVGLLKFPVGFYIAYKDHNPTILKVELVDFLTTVVSLIKNVALVGAALLLFGQLYPDGL